MKIFLSFLQSDKIHPIPAYNFWQYYLKNGIEEAGHQWVDCLDVDWALGLVPQTKTDHLKWKEETWTKVVVWLQKNPVDLFLSYLYPQQIDVSAIHEIKKLGIPCVNFFCDNVREFSTAPIEFAAFDINWVPEHKALKLYTNAGYNYINLPMPMWIAPTLRTYKPESNNQVTFIGSKDIQRHLLFDTIVTQEPEIPLAIYGQAWNNENITLLPSADHSIKKRIFYQYDFLKKHGIQAYLRKIDHRKYDSEISAILKSKLSGPITFDQYNKLTAESMVTLGINRYPSYQFTLNRPNTYSRLRDIEAPMLGACYLTEYTDGIEELYDIGHEIEVYKTVEDLIEKVKELQADHSKRTNLKIKGQNRALKDHTIPVSINKIIQRLTN